MQGDHVATDGDMHPLFRTEAVKTYSLLANIAILSGVMMVAAVLLGLFLGVGRAWPSGSCVESQRQWRSKFLSLHLAPQNKAPEFDKQGLRELGISGKSGRAVHGRGQSGGRKPEKAGGKTEKILLSD